MIHDIYINYFKKKKKIKTQLFILFIKLLFTLNAIIFFFFFPLYIK